MRHSSSRISPSKTGIGDGSRVVPSLGKFATPVLVDDKTQPGQRPLMSRRPGKRLALLLLTVSAAVIAVSWTMGSSQVGNRVARLAERERVMGPVLQVAVEADRVCAFLGGGSGTSDNTTDDDLADTASELNANESSVYDDNQTTVLAAEHVLLLVKAVSADLSDAFSDRYDMGFLNITAPAGVGGAEGQPFSGSWLWVHRPYWPLVRQWFYGIFSFGVVSPRLYHQDVVLVPGMCPGRQPSHTGYHEVTMADLWDDNLSWQMESGAAKQCPGMRASALFRSDDGDALSDLREATCSPDPDTGLANMTFEAWTLSNDSNLMAIIWYSVALAVVIALMFAAWAVLSTKRLIHNEQDFLQYMLLGFRAYGWCQLSDGAIIVHIPWEYAEEALREVLRRRTPLSASADQENDSSTSSEARLANDIASALGNCSQEERDDKMEKWLGSIRDCWPHLGLFVLGKETEPYTQRTVETISYNGVQSSGLAVYRAILGLYHERKALEPSDPLHTLASLLKPVAWSSADNGRRPEANFDEETGGTAAVASPSQSTPTSEERRPLHHQFEPASDADVGRPTLGSFNNNQGVSSNRKFACWPFGHEKKTTATVQVGAESPEQLMGVWLLVERLALAVLEAIFVWFDNDEEACGMDAMEEGPNSGGKSGAAATPRQSNKVVNKKGKERRSMSVKSDDGSVDTVKEYRRMTGVTLFPGARFHLILAAVVQGLIWCALAALWMPAVFATAVITHDDYNDGQDDGLPMLLLIPSCVVILLGLLDYIWHDGIFSPGRYHSPMLLLFPRVVRRAQQIVLASTCLFGAWYGCMVLLWFLLALLLRGAAALPAVLMVVGGAAVILRQRARSREGAFQNLMSIDNEIENEIGEEQENAAVEEDGEDDDKDDESGDEGEGDEQQGEADGDGDGEGSEGNELSLRDTLRSWKQQRRKGLAASRRWMRWNSARSTLPLSSQLLIYAAIIAAFACLTAFVILGAVAFGVGGAEVFTFVAVIASLAVDFLAQSQHRRLLQRANMRTKPATSAAAQFVHSAVVDADRLPTKEEEANMLLSTLHSLIKALRSPHRPSLNGEKPSCNGPGYPYPHMRVNRANDNMHLLPKIYKMLKKKDDSKNNASMATGMEDRPPSLVPGPSARSQPTTDTAELEAKLDDLLAMARNQGNKLDALTPAVHPPVADKSVETLEVAKNIMSEVREARSCVDDGFADNVARSDAILAAIEGLKDTNEPPNSDDADNADKADDAPPTPSTPVDDSSEGWKKALSDLREDIRALGAKMDSHSLPSGAEAPNQGDSTNDESAPPPASAPTDVPTWTYELSKLLEDSETLKSRTQQIIDALSSNRSSGPTPTNVVDTSNWEGLLSELRDHLDTLKAKMNQGAAVSANPDINDDSPLPSIVDTSEWPKVLSELREATEVLKTKAQQLADAASASPVANDLDKTNELLSDLRNDIQAMGKKVDNKLRAVAVPNPDAAASGESAPTQPILVDVTEWANELSKLREDTETLKGKTQEIIDALSSSGSTTANVVDTSKWEGLMLELREQLETMRAKAHEGAPGQERRDEPPIPYNTDVSEWTKVLSELREATEALKTKAQEFTGTAEVASAAPGGVDLGLTNKLLSDLHEQIHALTAMVHQGGDASQPPRSQSIDEAEWRAALSDLRTDIRALTQGKQTAAEAQTPAAANSASTTLQSIDTSEWTRMLSELRDAIQALQSKTTQQDSSQSLSGLSRGRATNGAEEATTQHDTSEWDKSLPELRQAIDALSRMRSQEGADSRELRRSLSEVREEVSALRTETQHGINAIKQSIRDATPPRNNMDTALLLKKMSELHGALQELQPRFLTPISEGVKRALAKITIVNKKKAKGNGDVKWKRQKAWLAERLDSLDDAVGNTGKWEVDALQRELTRAMRELAERLERGDRERSEKAAAQQAAMARKLDGIIRRGSLSVSNNDSDTPTTYHQYELPVDALADKMTDVLEASPKLARILEGVMLSGGGSEAARFASMIQQLNDTAARNMAELKDTIFKEMRRWHGSVIQAMSEKTEAQASNLLSHLQHYIKEFVSMVKRIVKENKGPDMKLPPDLHEGIARAVAEGISYHAIISPALFQNRALWPFSKPHKNVLPQKGDTLAEAFIRILRIYLTPYSFAPISQPAQPVARGVRAHSAVGGGPGRPQHLGNIADRQAVTPRTGGEPLASPVRPASTGPHRQRHSPDDADDPDAVPARKAWDV